MSILPYDMDRFRDQVTLADKDYTDWHSKNTITFGSLLDDGYDWGQYEWTSYTMTNEALVSLRDRLNTKIEERYRYRELGVLPVRRFRDNLVRTINDAVAAQGPIYNEILKGLDITNNGKEFVKKRDVRSSFPQSQLSPDTQDYASSAIEGGRETINSGNQIKAIRAFNEAFDEPDAAILDYINVCFSNYISFDY